MCTLRSMCSHAFWAIYFLGFYIFKITQFPIRKMYNLIWVYCDQQLVVYNKNVLVVVIVTIIIILITFQKYFLLYKRRARQVDKRTGEIPNIAYIILLDALWYFNCPSCPRDGKIASYHLKSSEKKAHGKQKQMDFKHIKSQK